MYSLCCKLNFVQLELSSLGEVPISVGETDNMIFNLQNTTFGSLDR
jgi:hypothetical protein